MALKDTLYDAIDLADARFVTGWYAAVSVDVERFRRLLRGSKRPFVDPEHPAAPLELIEGTAAWVIAHTRQQATAIGGLAGLAGWTSVPHEVVANAIALVRLAQRLAIVYGFDPGTDRGDLAVWQGLAAGLEIELPASGPAGIRVTDLPAVLVPREAPRTVAVALARGVAWRSVGLVAGRMTRFVPVIFAGTAAVAARTRTQAIAERMRATIRRLVEFPAGTLPDDAVEI